MKKLFIVSVLLCGVLFAETSRFEQIKNKIERNEKTKDITYNERFKINE